MKVCKKNKGSSLTMYLIKKIMRTENSGNPKVFGCAIADQTQVMSTMDGICTYDTYLLSSSDAWPCCLLLTQESRHADPRELRPMLILHSYVLSYIFPIWLACSHNMQEVNGTRRETANKVLRL